MKNLLHGDTDIEKLDELPKRVNNPLGGGKWGRYKGRDYPHRKVHRFLECRVGRNWNNVFSEYVHLSWIKDEDKTREKIGWNVEFNTLMKDGKVFYLDEAYGIPRPIEDARWGGGVFYVHPKTNCLCYSPKNKKKHKTESREETCRILGDYHQLVKINGVWHEIKGELVKGNIVEIDGLHYQKVKQLPETNKTVPAVYPPFPQKFFGQKVVEEPIKYKKTEDGYYLIPYNTTYYRRFHNTGYYSNRYDSQPVGPRERMIRDDEKARLGYYVAPRDYDSVRITLRRQLSSKELKKYGLHNDIKPVGGKMCSECGGINCMQNHGKRCEVCGERWCQKKH